MYGLGIDIGGTKVRVSVFENQTHIISIKKRYPSKDKNSVLATIYECITEALDKTKCKLSIIGMCVPGIVQNNVIKKLPNLPCLEKTDLVNEIKKQYCNNVFLLNDVDAFALGLYNFSPQFKTKRLIGLTFGTGLGGGIVINGQLLEGAGEFGQSHYSQDKIVETTVNGQFVIDHYYTQTKRKRFPIEILSESSKASIATRKQFVTNVSIVVANICNQFRPDCIVLGGALGLEVASEVKKAYHQFLFDDSSKTAIYKAPNKYMSPFGAYMYARKQKA